MNPSDVTLLVGVDSSHLHEWSQTWPTWRQHKPHLLEMPLVVFYDEKQVTPEQIRQVCNHPNAILIAWDLSAARSQREKMLSGFVHTAAKYVHTPWHLKLDTDLIAVGSASWVDASWLQADEHGRLPAFAAPQWGYTKPRYLMDVLDDWGDETAALRQYSRLNLSYSSASNKVRHPRISSHIFFGNTAWVRDVAAWLPADGRLPVPSHDSFLFYCAARRRDHYVRFGMKGLGWRHGRSHLKSHARTNPPPGSAEVAPGRPPQRGVIYYNTGTSCLIRLLVSLFSLRQHYSGPVTIVSEGEDSHELCQKIADALDAQVLRWDSGLEPGKNGAYLAKTRLYQASPYQTTVALDSDTLVQGDIEELFRQAEEHEFCVAQFAKWRTDGRIYSKRIRQWETLVPSHIESALNFGPAINTGVLAYKKEASILQEWEKVVLDGRHLFIPDEVSCQLLLPHHKHRILENLWNCSCRYDSPSDPSVKIIHYHGRKHCRPGLKFHGAAWITEYQRVVEANLADVHSWKPAGDRMLKRYLKTLKNGARAASVETPLPLQRPPVYETPHWCQRGHFNNHQADKFRELLAATKPRYALEIGFCTGRSAACVLHHATPRLRKLVSIDIDLDYKPQGRLMAEQLQQSFPQLRVIEGNSRKVLTEEFFSENFPKGVDFALVDGDHTYQGCTADLMAVSRHLRDGGVIVIDDYGSGPPHGVHIEAVDRSVNDFISNSGQVFSMEKWNNFGKGFCILRKKLR